MEKLLTIVIPSYNVETTLRQTVESMLVPDMSLRNLLDILIVNDGSKDGTLSLAKQFEAENPGIVRVWDKENGGHGSTINVGIDHGYGKYMKVVDGDDWLETDALEDFLNILQGSDADLVATDYCEYYIDSDEKIPIKTSSLPYGEVVKLDDIWKNYTLRMTSYTVKTIMLRNQPKRIDEHCYYVDVELDALVGVNVESFLYVDKKLYVYRIVTEGQSISIDGLWKHYLDHEKVGLTLAKWYDGFKLKDSEKGKMLESKVMSSVYRHYFLCLDFDKEKRKKYLAHLKEYDLKLKQCEGIVYRLSDNIRTVRYLRKTNFSECSYKILCSLSKYKQFIKSLPHRKQY